MAIVSVRELLQAGVHYGHRTSRRNPKMDVFIFGKRNAIHIIDLRQTVRGLARAGRFLREIARRNELILLVGTKRQAVNVVEAQAKRAELPYVTERWLGGTLTNYRTIRSRLGRLEELEALERTGDMNRYSKKVISALQRERRKIRRNLEGVRSMDRLPGALIVVDPRRERIAVLEAKRLGIPIVALLDTDCNPDPVDIAIPCNDDAMRSLQLLLGKLVDTILEGRQEAPMRSARPGQPAAAPTTPDAAEAAPTDQAAPETPAPAEETAPPEETAEPPAEEPAPEPAPETAPPNPDAAPEETS